MTLTKDDEQIYCLKTIEFATTPTPFHVDVINAFFLINTYFSNYREDCLTMLTN